MIPDDELSLLELASLQDQRLLHEEIRRQSALLSSQRGGPMALKRIGIAWHNLAIASVNRASTQADNHLRRAQRVAPSDPEIMAFLGSSQTMVARDAWNPATKALQLNQGLKLIDRAIREAPENVIVRMVRMTNSLSLPAFVGRAPKAREDLLQLQALFERTPPHPQLAAEVSFRLGELLRQQGQRKRALELFEQALECSPDSIWGVRARQALGAQRPLG